MKRPLKITAREMSGHFVAEFEPPLPRSQLTLAAMVAMSADTGIYPRLEIDPSTKLVTGLGYSMRYVIFGQDFIERVEAMAATLDGWQVEFAPEFVT